MKPYVASGKEVLLNGVHFADAVGYKEAELIVGALNLVDQLAKARKRKK